MVMKQTVDPGDPNINNTKIDNKATNNETKVVCKPKLAMHTKQFIAICIPIPYQHKFQDNWWCLVYRANNTNKKTHENIPRQCQLHHLCQ